MSERKQYWLQWTDMGEEFIHCDPPGIHFETDNIDELPELTHVVELKPDERIFSRGQVIEILRKLEVRSFANYEEYNQLLLNELFPSEGEIR